MVHQYTDEEIRDRVEIALRILFKNDSFLLKHNVHERAIAHELAEYLQILFPDWNVDLEYNKSGEDPKRLETSDGNKQIYPDIIIHKRGKQDNLLAMEIKKSNNDENRDISKLEDLTNQDKQYKYNLGLFIRFNETNALWINYHLHN